ncbi:MAG: hypothetical protein KDI81_07115, partial [Xanthomonadales bacterium]|nr:hypothetical protein [Xanthomonadales bacterium]
MIATYPASRLTLTKNSSKIPNLRRFETPGGASIVGRTSIIEVPGSRGEKHYAFESGAAVAAQALRIGRIRDPRPEAIFAAVDIPAPTASPDHRPKPTRLAADITS